jgi:hypothetical protein
MTKLTLRNHLLGTLSLHAYMYDNTCGQMIRIANLPDHRRPNSNPSWFSCCTQILRISSDNGIFYVVSK